MIKGYRASYIQVDSQILLIVWHIWDTFQLNWKYPCAQVISVKTFWLRSSLIDFVLAGMFLWNTETDKRCIVVELYQFLNICYWFVRIFSSSDNALLVRAKHQKNLRKTWISRLDLYLITSDLTIAKVCSHEIYPMTCIRKISMSSITNFNTKVYSRER